MTSRKKKASTTPKKVKDLAPPADQVQGGNLKLMNEVLSNVSKTRSEISQTFARNSRA